MSRKKRLRLTLETTEETPEAAVLRYFTGQKEATPLELGRRAIRLLYLPFAYHFQGVSEAVVKEVAQKTIWELQNHITLLQRAFLPETLGIPMQLPLVGVPLQLSQLTQMTAGSSSSPLYQAEMPAASDTAEDEPEDDAENALDQFMSPENRAKIRALSPFA